MWWEEEGGGSVEGMEMVKRLLFDGEFLNILERLYKRAAVE